MCWKLSELQGIVKVVFGTACKELIDTFKSKDDAIKKGYTLFGNEPFLVKKIVPTDTTLYFTSRLIAAKITG